MRARISLLLLLATLPITAQKISNADAHALVGRNYLHLGRLRDAETLCDAAIKEDPANTIAKKCLGELAGMLIDRDLNDATAELAKGNKDRAKALAAKYINTPVPQQRQRAWAILARTGTSFPQWWEQTIPDWLRQLLLTMAVLTVAWLIL